MDIEGLGDKLVDQLVENGLASGYGDLYRLTADRLVQLERMGKKSSENLLAGIEASRERGLARLLNALSIRHVGGRVATVLAESFGSMDRLEEATVDRLAEINEIGEIIAESVYNFLHGDYGASTVEELRELGVNMQAPKKGAQTGEAVFAGKTFVVTGTLIKYTRDQVHELIEQHGGRASSSVSKKTDYVLAGEKAGSKLTKAEKLSVPVISEDEFEKMIAGVGGGE
jgi:DNA ligase (NAD+)